MSEPVHQWTKTAKTALSIEDEETFDNENEALLCLNNSLDIWGYDHTILAKDLLRKDSSPDRRKIE